MQGKLFFIRKTKYYFFRLRLHKVFGPFTRFMLNLANLSRLSAWIHEHRASVKFNDFPARKWDYSKRYALYDKLVETEDLSGPVDYLEFGVCGGQSFEWWAKRNTDARSRFYGFDTFTGLPEDWGFFKAGAMSTDGAIPELQDERARFIKGMFQDTLQPFLAEFKNEHRKIIHMDADLYSSTLYVLGSMAHLLRPGDIIIFDEFAVPMHEFLAFTEFVKAFRIEYDVLVAYNNYFFVAVKIR